MKCTLSNHWRRWPNIEPERFTAITVSLKRYVKKYTLEPVSRCRDPQIQVCKNDFRYAQFEIWTKHMPI